METTGCFELVIYFLWNFLMEMLDVEKLTFFLFCGNKRRLQKAGK